MWPVTDIPALGMRIASYHLFHVIAWFAFYFLGTALTRAEPRFKRLWLGLSIGLAFRDTLGARAAYRMIHGDESHGYFAAPLLFAVLTVAVCVIGRVRTHPFLDAWTIAFAGSHVFEKLSCLLAGCCFGRKTDSFVGVSLATARDDAARFIPLPLFESLLHLGTAVCLFVCYRRGLFKGRLLPILGLVYGSWRSLVETVRDVDGAAFLDGPLSLTQVACVLVATFSCAYLIQGLATDRRVSPAFR